MKKSFALLLLFVLIETCSNAYDSRSSYYGYSSYSAAKRNAGNYSRSSYYSSAAASSKRYNSAHSSYTKKFINNQNSLSRPNLSIPSSYKTGLQAAKSYDSYYQRNIQSGVNVVPFRYNTSDYTRVRKMEADPPKSYSSRCTDMGDASFCR